jgi:hypothetical protein
MTYKECGQVLIAFIKLLLQLRLHASRKLSGLETNQRVKKEASCAPKRFGGGARKRSKENLQPRSTNLMN